MFFPLPSESSLLGFFVESVLAAELAVLVHFDSVRVILLVFLGVVIALLALSACQCNFNSHFGTSYFIIRSYERTKPPT